MLRLGMMLVGTVAAIMIVLSAFGGADSDARRSDTAKASEPVEIPQSKAAPVDEAPQLVVELPPDEAETEVVDPESQTPEKMQEFPGPALRPSPEYADETEVAEVASHADADTATLYVTGSKVNLRAGPTTNDAVIGTVSLGDAVVSLGSADGGWVNVQTQDGRIGYLSGSFLSTTAP